MIFGAYFTGHKSKLPPAATPKVGDEKNRWSKNPSNRLRMTPKHLPQSDFNDRQKLPPAAIPKVEGEKNSMVQKPIKSIGNDPKTPPTK